MSFDFGSIDFDAGDIASDIEVSPDAADYGAETLADSSDQVGDFAGNSEFVDATDPSSITNAPTEVAGGDFVGPPAPSSIDQAISGAKDSLASAADKVKDAASGAFDKIKAGAESTLTKLESQFSAKNIEAFATKTAKSLITQVESTAINLAKQTANQALSRVVGPAVASTLTNGITRSLTGPTTNSATAVKSSVDPNSPNFVGPPAPSNTSPASPATDEYPPGEYTTDSKGNTFKTLPDGTSSLVRAVEQPDTVPGDYTTDSKGNTYVTLPDGTTALYRSAEVIESTDQPVNAKTDPQAQQYVYRTESDGNTYQVDAAGNRTLYRAAEVSDTVPGEYTTDSKGNTYITLPDGTTSLYRAAEVIESTGQPVNGDTDPQVSNPNAAGNAVVRSFTPGTVNDPGLAIPPLNTIIDGVVGAAVGTARGLIGTAANAVLAEAASRTQGLIRQAQNQQTARVQNQNKAQAGDWRVRLSLAPTSNYLYNAPDCGPVLWPLYNTNGVIFPYTPSIDIGYKANYTQYDLTHSNYRGYFYQNSYVDGVNIKATFTAQDTAEANYLLAVIHFFRSVTKMFYGQDAQAGAPPPLVFLSGLGDFQFNQHPCVVSQFNYSLPADVNYIRAQNVANNATNQLAARNRQTTLGNPVSNAIQRLASLGQGIRPGALTAPFAPQGSLAANNPTYVPTKMEISLTLLPVQSRQQVSQQFSLAGFANGNLLKGGFW